MFVGNSAGNGILTIGGKYYVDIVDAATSANASNNLVKRNLSGDFSARHITATQFVGNASSANTLSPGRYIASGGDMTGNVAFDGSQNINLALTLAATGVTAATYGAGDGTQIPVITVDSKGRITLASNAAAGGGASFSVKGNTGSDTIVSGDSLSIYGGDGASATVLANTGNTVVVVGVDNTVVRTTGNQTIGGNKTFSNDVIVQGNFNVTGTTTYVNSTDLHIGDNQIVLNADLGIGSAPTEDAGIVINRGNENANAAILWDETNNYWVQTTNNLLSTATTRLFHDGYANATSMSTGIIPVARFTGAAAPPEGSILQVAANGAQMWSVSIDGGAF
jgi:hypothetical protein